MHSEQRVGQRAAVGEGREGGGDRQPDRPDDQQHRHRQHAQERTAARQHHRADGVHLLQPLAALTAVVQFLARLVQRNGRLLHHRLDGAALLPCGGEVGRVHAVLAQLVTGVFGASLGAPSHLFLRRLTCVAAGSDSTGSSAHALTSTSRAPRTLCHGFPPSCAGRRRTVPGSCCAADNPCPRTSRPYTWGTRQQPSRFPAGSRQGTGRRIAAFGRWHRHRQRGRHRGRGQDSGGHLGEEGGEVVPGAPDLLLDGEGLAEPYGEAGVPSCRVRRASRRGHRICRCPPSCPAARPCRLSERPSGRRRRCGRSGTASTCCAASARKRGRGSAARGRGGGRRVR